MIRSTVHSHANRSDGDGRLEGVGRKDNNGHCGYNGKDGRELAWFKQARHCELVEKGQYIGSHCQYNKQR